MDRTYRFVQWELPWALGPADGRYPLRDIAAAEPHHVLVLKSLPAPARRFFPGRRARGADPEPAPAQPALTRATLVDVERVDDEAARRWVQAAVEDESVVTDALQLLNEVIRCHRAATADPYVAELRSTDALVVRAGCGIGMEVAEGQWSYALELRPSRDQRVRRERRETALRPHERLAALLSARDAVLACEELVLRARLDLDQGRSREAALQAHLALEAAVSELQAFRDVRGMADRLAALEGDRDAVAAVANEALRGGLPDGSVAAVIDVVERIEAALRARSAAAPY